MDLTEIDGGFSDKVVFVIIPYFVAAPLGVYCRLCLIAMQQMKVIFKMRDNVVIIFESFEFSDMFLVSML